MGLYRQNAVAIFINVIAIGGELATGPINNPWHLDLPKPKAIPITASDSDRHDFGPGYCGSDRDDCGISPACFGPDRHDFDPVYFGPDRHNFGPGYFDPNTWRMGR